MKLVSFKYTGRFALGIVENRQVIDLRQAAAAYQFKALDIHADLKSFLTRGESAFEAAAELVDRIVSAGDQAPAGTLVQLEDVRVLAPIRDPGKIVCVGLNYMDHCRETGTPVPKKPILFTKFTSSIIGPGDPITWSPETSSQVDYEAELAVVIGKLGRNVPVEKAGEYIAGYTIVNDISARDAQFEDGQWIRGKSFDTFCPMGPFLVTPDEFPNPQNAGIRCKVNGALLQDSNTREMIFNIHEIIAYISSTCTLYPGDVIATGTPHGVGFARTPPIYLQPGDSVEIEIDGLGKLQNHVVPYGGQACC